MTASPDTFADVTVSTEINGDATTSTEPGGAAYVRQFQADVDALPTYRPRIAAVIPADDEAESIEGVLGALLRQSRLPDEIHVVVDNTQDDTFALAATFAGPRTSRRTPEAGQQRQTTTVYVHDIGENPDRKVGALNYGFAIVGEAAYFLVVDGDTTLAPDAVEKLEAEIVSDTPTGGISAIYWSTLDVDSWTPEAVDR